jgi:hypothetical protein
MFMRQKSYFTGPATAVIALGAMVWMGAPLAQAHLFSSNSAMSVGWVDKSEPLVTQKLKPRVKHVGSKPPQVVQPTSAPNETGPTSPAPLAPTPGVVAPRPLDASATTPRASKLNDLQVVPLE